MPDEFELIAQILGELGNQQTLELGPGDDCALVNIEPGQQLASSIDTFLAGQHFPGSANPWLIAQRCLRGALSDLAAMGAKPSFALVSLSMPSADSGWLKGFAQGMRDVATRFACPIAGGNLSSAALGVSISVHGCVPAGGALTRSGAQAGQQVYVSGLLGGAAAGVLQVTDEADPRALQALTLGDWRHPLNRYWLPEPRLSLGQGLIGLASAAIDISDGLYADAAHLAESSRVGLRLDTSALPAIGEMAQSDDYELLFTAPPGSQAAIDALGARLGVPITLIGVTTGQPGVWADEARVELSASGYKHF